MKWYQFRVPVVIFALLLAAALFNLHLVVLSALSDKPWAAAISAFCVGVLAHQSVWFFLTLADQKTIRRLVRDSIELHQAVTQAIAENIALRQRLYGPGPHLVPRIAPTKFDD